MCVSIVEGDVMARLTRAMLLAEPHEAEKILKDMSSVKAAAVQPNQHVVAADKGLEKVDEKLNEELNKLVNIRVEITVH